MPLYSSHANGWAGPGFYFWESDIRLAHWWGRSHCKGRYLIAKSQIDFSDKCFDLYDNPDHKEEIRKIWKLLKEDTRLDTKSTSLSTVLRYLRENDIFDFEAIRFCGINSIGTGNSTKKFRSRISFTDDYDENKPEQYVDLCPPIQYCLFSENSLNHRDYIICFER